MSKTYLLRLVSTAHLVGVGLHIVYGASAWGDTLLGLFCIWMGVTLSRVFSRRQQEQQ